MRLLASVQAWLAMTMVNSVQSTQTSQGPRNVLPPGCGKQHNTGYYGGDGTTFNIVSGRYTRYYAVNIPCRYDSRKPSPLIMDFHANEGTSFGQYLNSEYWLKAAGRQYLTVYPQGYEQHWQGPSCAVEGVNDTQVVTDLLAHLNEEYCIEWSRVYASGKSNGGGFVNTLACSDAGNGFAAFAIASAALYTDNSLADCTKKRAILESHGDMDSVVPYGGNKTAFGGSEPNIKQWVPWWGERVCGEGAVANQIGDLGGYNITSFSCDGLADVVKHYQVFGLGHCWPSSTGQNWDAWLGPGGQHCATDRVLDYAGVVLDWFGRWTLDTAPKNN